MNTTEVEAYDGRKYQAAVRPRKPDGADEPVYDFGCSCRFRSYGWPTEALAQERGLEHIREHVEGKEAVTSELADFKKAVSWDVDASPPPSEDPFAGDDNGLLNPTTPEA